MYFRDNAYFYYHYFYFCVLKSILCLLFSQNLRRYSPVFVGNQRAVSSWKANREDVWYGQPRMSGFVPGLAGNGNNFWLPWYR